MSGGKKLKTYFSALSAENLRLAQEVSTLRMEALRSSMSAACAPPSRQALNQALAAANISLVRKLQDCIFSRDREEMRHTRLVRRLNERLVAVADTVHDLEEEKVDLKGELEGLQDVLAGWEEERSTMRRERVYFLDEERRLNQQLAAATRKVTDLEQEITRLQEPKGMGEPFRSAPAPSLEAES